MFTCRSMGMVVRLQHHSLLQRYGYGGETTASLLASEALAWLHQAAIPALAARGGQAAGLVVVLWQGLAKQQGHLLAVGPLLQSQLCLGHQRRHLQGAERGARQWRHLALPSVMTNTSLATRLVSYPELIALPAGCMPMLRLTCTSAWAAAASRMRRAMPAVGECGGCACLVARARSAHNRTSLVS